MFAHIHLDRNRILILNHYPVGANIDLAGVGILCNHTATSSQIRPAIEVMPLWSGKRVEVHLGFGHVILENRAAFDLLNGYGFVRGEFFSPGVKIVSAAQIGLDSHCGTGTLASAKTVGDDSE